MRSRQDPPSLAQGLLKLGEPARQLDLVEHFVDLALQPDQRSGPVLSSRRRL